MSSEARKDCRFYTSLFCAMTLALVGTFTPPIGELADSLLWAFFGLLALDCAILGVDVQEILREYRLLKESTFKQESNGEVVQDK